MRYYEVRYPGTEEPVILTNIRQLQDLPDSTTIQAVVTERDGSVVDYWEIPVVAGKPVVPGRGKARPKYHGLR